MARLRPVALAAVTALGLMLVACGTEGDAAAPPPSQPAPTEASPGLSPRPSSEPSAPTPAPTSEPAATVPEQLSFTAKTVDGKDFSGESLFGKPAVLWFWTPWCPNCQAEAPAIAEVAKSATVRFVGVAAQDEVSTMQDFVDRYQLGSFPHIADSDLAVWKRFGVQYQPAYAFVTAAGEVEVETDQLNKDDLLARVRALG